MKFRNDDIALCQPDNFIEKMGNVKRKRITSKKWRTSTKLPIYLAVVAIVLILANWISPLIIKSSAAVIHDQNKRPSFLESQGRHIYLNNALFQIKGVGYAPTKIGDDPESSSPNGDYFTEQYSDIYNRDFPLIRGTGANTIRLWGWKYDADHSDFLDAAYNNGVAPLYVIVSYWLDASRDISDPTERQKIKAEFTQMIAIHKDHPAVLMWSIGNELNAPWMFGDSDDLFSLLEEMAEAAHDLEGSNFHPVTTPLADSNLISTITQRDSEVPNLDVWSVQIYRGSSFGTFFSDYAALSQKPLVITEFGIDAYDDHNSDEYENIGSPYQAVYAESLWNEIAANSDICSGGTIMAYSDEWWKGKHGQNDSNHQNCPEFDPNFHSDCGYPNNGHPDQYANEEWWGIMRVIDNGKNPDIMQTRAIYHTLQSLWANRNFIPLVMNTP
jgi:hypothetical protein